LLLIGFGVLFADSAEALQDKTNSGKSPVVKSNQITMIVMDPLCSQLACDCVKGYAQRDYQKFGLHLSRKTGRPVHVVFSETLADGMSEADGKVDIVIGKQSVVLAGAQEQKVDLMPVFRLTDKQDSTEQTGLLVVRSGNSANTVADLQGYRVLYGPASCEEKYAAPKALLKEHGIQTVEPAAGDICSACSVAAKELAGLSDNDKVVGVISSYAFALLEGCGNVRKGDLRVVGQTRPVPFITVFFSSSFLNEDETLTREAFADVELDVDLMTALETGSGFVPYKESTASTEDNSANKDDSKKKSSVGG
jgi:ABC-type phosphate/phosphonate transport system substrate-binding protein